MNIFINAFYYEFIEKTNTYHIDFLIDLFKKLFNEEINISEKIEDCDILLESIFSKEIFIHKKEWKYTFLFYYESYENIIQHYGNERFKDFDKYTCILCGERNYKNIVNLPLFIPYNNETKNQEILSEHIIAENVRDTDSVIYDIKQVIFPKKWPLINNILIISSPEFELKRYNDIKNEFKEYNVQFICPTYKHTITDEMYDYYVKDKTRLLCWNRILYKSELSLILNHVSVLKHIEKNFKDGIFLILESDVTILDNNNQFNDFLEIIKTKKNGDIYNWDVISLGSYSSEKINEKFNTWYEIDKDDCINGKIVIIRKKETNCTDSFLWSYSGIKKFLKILENINDYNFPYDFIINEIIQKYPEFKYYWSMIPFFLQKSNFNISSSTIK